MKILVTGGAGFIGTALCEVAVKSKDYEVICVDKLSYAANRMQVQIFEESENYHFCQVDLCNAQALNAVLHQYQPDRIMHLAAESHVDRSIQGPAEFIQSNILGTYNLLEAARLYYDGLSGQKAQNFRLHHISTDEVYGALGETGHFTEETAYDPRSPYSASKASSDHLVRAWYHTYGLPIVLTNCSNNYGPYQYPEKFIPVVIKNALGGKPIPVYGAGQNIRDWIYVFDHVEALLLVLEQGLVGESYNIGGECEKRNIDMARLICRLIDDLRPDSVHLPHDRLISFVEDRPGHDFRYAIDNGKIRAELHWSPRISLEEGMRRTIEWYLSNQNFLYQTETMTA